jgi:DNA primase
LLPTEVIEEIRQSTDLVKLIGEVVSLKRSGSSYTGRCPFHDEKTPSFSVSPSKQLYHCFGCAEGGTAITFMMKYYHLPFIDAIEKLADRLGIDLTKYQQQQNSKQFEFKKKMLDVLGYAAERYHHVLSTSFGKEAIEYLTGKRGLTTETINDFQVGFVPDGWEHMSNALIRDGKSVEIAAQAGLLAKRQKGTGMYDVFRNRIMIPIRNPKGNIVGFGGRGMKDEKPKYLNSPQSEVFDKGRLLFGLSQAEKSIREKGFAIIVEGYFDQMTLFQHGFRNTVATLGTALTEHHAELLKRYTDQIVVIFDGDKAGMQASKRSMGPLLSNGFQPKLVRIPGGADPDSYVQEQGVDSFENLIREAKFLSDEMIHLSYNQEADLSKKAEFLEDLSEIIHRTKNVYFKEVLLAEFSKKTGVDKTRFSQNASFSDFKTAKPAPTVKTNENYVEEITILRLFAEAPAFRSKIQEGQILSLFPEGEFYEAAKQWMDKIEQQSTGNMSSGGYVDLWTHDATRAKLAKVFMDAWEEKDSFYEKTLLDCLGKLRNKQVPRLTAEVEVATQAGQDQKVQTLLKQIQQLKTPLVEN